MNIIAKKGARLVLAACALIFELAHLGWEHLHGGVAAHHLLQRADMPAITNWWGVLLIPALTWFLVGRIERRIAQQPGGNAGSALLARPILAGLIGSLAYGAALSLAFVVNSAALPFIFLGLFVVSVFVPTYRAQYVLGFVLGMTFTFGAVLPTVIALVLASFARLVHLLVGSVRRLFRNSGSPRPLPGD